MSADAARQLHRLAVLLSAGLSPPTAWAWLAEQAQDAPSAALLRAAADAVAQARPLGPALTAAMARGDDTADASAWRAVAAVWELAALVGAPLSPVLSGFASVVRARAQRQRELAVILAGPRATSRMLVWLPVLGAMLAGALGIGVLPVLVGTPAGWAMLCLAGVLLWAGRSWMRGILRRAEPEGAIPGLALELMAVALGGGAAATAAQAAWAGALESSGLDCNDQERRLLDSVLALSDSTGAPATGLLRAEAEVLRAEAEAVDRERIEVAAVRLLLPLGVCMLPAFVLLAVIPAVVSILAESLIL